MFCFHLVVLRCGCDRAWCAVYELAAIVCHHKSRHCAYIKKLWCNKYGVVEHSVLAQVIDEIAAIVITKAVIVLAPSLKNLLRNMQMVRSIKTQSAQLVSFSSAKLNET